MSLSIQVDSKKRKGGFVKMGIQYHHCICLFQCNTGIDFD
jgi:hypothetical protein